MIDFADALAILLDKVPGPKGVESVPLEDALGRVLCQDILSDVNLPPFRRSGMDGFAVQTADLQQLPAALQVVMDIPAGTMPTGAIGPGKAASIMTGAPVPDGADGVVQVEWTSGFGKDTVVVNQGIEPGKNVSPLGEIMKEGDTALCQGTSISVEEVGLLAAVGCAEVPVFIRPKVAVMSTGDEVVPPGEKPAPSQIRDVNGPAMVAFAKGLGLEVVNLGTISDNPVNLHRAIQGALACDCVLLSGGVSAGEYDYVEEVFAKLGIENHFRRVGIKPGKPTVFGTHNGTVVFGLPGNPVSAMVIARLLVGASLQKQMGLANPGYCTMRARLTTDLKKKPDRQWFVHGQIEYGDMPSVTPLRTIGSADIPAATRGNCLIVAPKNKTRIPKGTTVEVVVWERSLWQ